MYMSSILEITALYFLTFEKADCTKFTLSVGWLVGVTINFLPQIIPQFLLRSSSPPQKIYFPSTKLFLLILLRL